MHQKRVSTLVLPSAGLGRRLRPLTNRIPKALVRLHRKPLLSYMLHEAEGSGMKKVVIVVSKEHKSQFKEYLKTHAQYFPGITKIYIRVQRKPLGDGHAVFEGIDVLGKQESVAVRFHDDLVASKIPILVPLLAWHARLRSSMLLLERVPQALVSRYGIVEVREKALGPIPSAPKGRAHRLLSLIEKPSREEAPSRLAVMGGYVLTPSFLSRLKYMAKNLAEECKDALRLADVFRVMLSRGERVYGYEFREKKLDCGTIEGLKDAERYMRHHKEYGERIK